MSLVEEITKRISESRAALERSMEDIGNRMQREARLLEPAVITIREIVSAAPGIAECDHFGFFRVCICKNGGKSLRVTWVFLANIEDRAEDGEEVSFSMIRTEYAGEKEDSVSSVFDSVESLVERFAESFAHDVAMEQIRLAKGIA